MPRAIAAPCRLAFLSLILLASSLKGQQSPPKAPDPVLARLEAVRPEFSDPRTRRLEVLAQIWGDLGQFHPVPSAERLHWDGVLVAAVRELDGVRTDREFANLINRVVMAPLHDPLEYATTIAQDKSVVTYPAPLTARWLSPGTAYISAVHRLYAGPYHVPEFAAQLRAVIDSLRGERPLQRLVVDLRSASRVYYREGTGGLWLGMWASETLRLGTPISLFRETDGSDLSQFKWLVSPRDSLLPLDPVISVPTVFLANRTSYAAGEAALDAIRTARSDVAVILEAGGPIPNLGYNAWQRWYPDSLLMPHTRVPIVSTDGALGSMIDLIAPDSVGFDQLGALATEALARRASQAPRRPFSFEDARITDDTVSTTAPTREERIAGLLKVWYWVGHAYAYYDDITGDWRRLVSDWLQRVEAAPDLRSYYRVMSEVGALLNDGHTWVEHPIVTDNNKYPRPFCGPPIYLSWSGGRLGIARVDTVDGTLGISPGDEVVAIDGQPTIAYERSQRAVRSVSRSGDRLQPAWLTTGNTDSLIRFAVRTRTGDRTVALRRSTCMHYFTTAWDHPMFEVLPGNVGYVNLAKLDSREKADSALAALAGVQGLVLDDRAPASSRAEFPWPRFLDGVSPWMGSLTTVAYRHGGYEPARGLVSTPAWDVFTLNPDPRRDTRPLVILTAGTKQSGGESLAIWFRIKRRATLVGTPTNGTYGSMQRITIPGGARFSFTGVRGLFPDGGKYHGVGVVPDVLVEPTFAGLRAGRDEVYEQGLTTLRTLLTRSPARIDRK